MQQAQKIIIYICPGHQLSEFVPWLINHSPEMDHGYEQLEDDWTHYDSSFGEGWEPIESHWNLSMKFTLEYKNKARASDSFPTEFFEDLFNYWKEEDLNGTKCIFFNLMPENYVQWTKELKEWFNTNHNDKKLILVGHTLYIDKMINPSRFFIKEGYITDNSVARNNINDNMQGISLIIKRKNKARGDDLSNLYKQCGFDIVWNIEDIQDITRCKHMISTLVEPPTNFNDLYKQYMDLNPPDIELDNLIKSVLK